MHRSDGGQKGLRSIIEHMGTENVPRIRVGVGAKPRPDYEMTDWVLGVIPAEDREAMFDAFARVAEALPLVIEGKFADAASRYNGKPKTKEPEAKKSSGAQNDDNSGDNAAEGAGAQKADNAAKQNAEPANAPGAPAAPGDRAGDTRENGGGE